MGTVIALLALVGNVRTTWSFSAFTVLIYYAITNLAALGGGGRGGGLSVFSILGRATGLGQWVGVAGGGVGLALGVVGACRVMIFQ